MTKNKAVVLLSGGLDSVVSLADIIPSCSQILALTFNYGQKSFERELYFSQKISSFYNIKHKCINLDWLKEISDSSLITNKSLPELTQDDLDNIDITKKSAHDVWVPNRNALFVNIAACFCEALGYNSIVIGANSEEAETFKDNSLEFIESINLSLKNSSNAEVKVIAPLINLNKTQCESCLRLKRALENNNGHAIIDKIFLKV